ncbi:hypothetical protein [Pseudoxanthomonas sp. PXM01]|uniref:hypothetical protein n=1 Tax=Pseudoxanthomonas sp. PXM01 TaxID=2769295 RepID=UPI00178471BF|nr:hypothetical protein [Pseudoxanthomonas sp. PXM01]MBD9471169.1 hypothetical protein [Pseudoxanthomonas sp. PXM01]
MLTVDVSSAAAQDYKADECRFFLELARAQTDRSRFRWLVSAFLSAAYSFFDQAAYWACISQVDESTGEDTADEILLSAVREHIDVTQNKKYASYVKTTASRGVLQQLYEIRQQNTHRSSLSIMCAGESLPDDFHLGWELGKGLPLLEFCDEVMTEIEQLRFKREACEAEAWPPPRSDSLPDDA